jgi:hypothetical protein
MDWRKLISNISRCPICSDPEEYHENPERLLICDQCKNLLMPELSDEECEFEFPSIGDYSGLIVI